MYTIFMRCASTMHLPKAIKPGEIRTVRTALKRALFALGASWDDKCS